MKTHTAHRPRKGSQEALYESQLEIGLTPTAWRAVRAAAVQAVDSKLSRFALIPYFFPLVDKAIASFRTGNYDKGEPTVVIRGMVSSWILIADAVLKFGSPESQAAGRVIACGASQILHCRPEED